MNQRRTSLTGGKHRKTNLNTENHQKEGEMNFLKEGGVARVASFPLKIGEEK